MIRWMKILGLMAIWGNRRRVEVFGLGVDCVKESCLFKYH